MPRLKNYDRAAVDALVRAGQGIVKHAELIALGMPKSTITHLIGARGRWQRLLPGVILANRGTPTDVDRRRAALVYAGPGARITGWHALAMHGALRQPLPPDQDVEVVIPAGVHRTSSSFCVVERSERDPGTTTRQGLPVTSVARACADAVRGHSMTLDDVRELMSEILRNERATLKQLEREVLSGPTQRSGHARAALRELGVGIRSSAEAKLLALVNASGLPQPEWNQDVVINGRWIGEADAYWRKLGVVVELDSMMWHLGAKALRRTQKKARRYAAAGLILVSVAPADLLADPQGFLDTLHEALAVAAARRAS